MAPTGQHGRRIGDREGGKQGRPSGWSNPARLVMAGPVGLLQAAAGAALSTLRRPTRPPCRQVFGFACCRVARTVK
jgi:hypothetical protein